MKYILMMNTVKANREAFPAWSKKDISGPHCLHDELE